jgi:hypothetical protein
MTVLVDATSPDTPTIMNSINQLTPQQLRQAADIQEQILELQHNLTQLLGAAPEPGAAAPGKRKKLSAQGLANIRAGAQKRWGKLKGTSGAAEAVPKPRRKMSPAGKRRLAASMKARWAAVKKAGKTSL